MISKEETKSKIKQLIDLYEKYQSTGQIDKFRGKEDNTKSTFIEPFFEALGWDVKNQENIEMLKEEPILKGAVDYAFLIKGQYKFFVEAKAIGRDLKDVKSLKEAAEQSIRYGVNSNNKYVVLTNFEWMVIFNCELKGQLWEKWLFEPMNYKDYLSKFEQIWILSKESALQNELDSYAGSRAKRVPRTPVDKELLQKFLKWREKLSKDLKKYPEEEIDEFVQKLLVRLLFIRNCEDRGFETVHTLWSVSQFYQIHKRGLLKLLRGVFKYYDVYDGSIFKESEIDSIEFNEMLLSEIINGLYVSEDEVKYDFDIIPADVMGKLYEQYLGHILKKTPQQAKLKEGKAHRKEQGIYYTPTYIVDYIVRNTLGELLKNKKVDASKIRILDPACGSGSFLVKSFDVLNEYWKQKDKDHVQKTWAENWSETYSKKERILINNIFGVDLDKQAVEIAQLNLLLRIAEKGQKLPLLKQNIKIGNSLIDDEKIAGEKAFKWEKEFKDIMAEEGFDVVVGNPPYFNIKSDDILKNSKDFKLLSEGVVNAAALFLKKGFDMLKKGGYLGFIIPKSFLIVDSWKPIRNLVLENAQITQVMDVGIGFEEVGLEQVIIIFKKTKLLESKVRILKSDKEINIIPQSFFRKREVILTSLDKEKYAIVERMEQNSVNLENMAEMPRGITIKSSEYKSNTFSGGIQVLGGTNLEKYKIKEGNKRKPNRYLSKENKNIQQKMDIFKQERIIYQNIASSVPKIVASLELNALPTDDTINNIIITDSRISNRYLLALLNSKLFTFYLRYAIINCSLLTIHLDKPYLGKFPVKIIPESQQQIIVKLVDKMLSLNKRLNEIGDKKTDERAKLEEEIKKTDQEIDELVYKIYGITEEEKKVIEESLR